MDINIYREIATRADSVHQGEHVNVDSEYPPLATTLFWAARSITSDTDFTAAWLRIIIGASLSAWIYLRCFSRRDATLFAIVLPISALLLGSEIVFARYDIFVALLLILSARAHKHRAYAESATWLTLSVALKIVPVFAIPVLIAATPRRHWKSLLLGFAFAATISIILSVGVLGVTGVIENIRYVMHYHAGRSVQLESFWSGLTMLQALAFGQSSHTGFDHMSVSNLDVAGHIIIAAKLLVILGLGFILVRMGKVRNGVEFGPLLTVTLLWTLAVSPVLSPQYFLWFVPLALILTIDRFVDGIVTPRGVCAFVLTLLIAYLTQWIFPTHYKALIEQGTVPVLILNLRNAGLFILTYVLLLDTGMLRSVQAQVLEKRQVGIQGTFLLDTILAGIALFLLIIVRPMLLVMQKAPGFIVNGSHGIMQQLPISVTLVLTLVVGMAALLWYVFQCYLLACAVLQSPLRAHATEMIYTRVVPWITSHLPALASSKTLPNGQMALSI